MAGNNSDLIANTAAQGGDAFDKAYTSVRASSDIQFALPPVPKTAPPPDWLVSLSKFVEPFFRAIGRGLSWLFNLMPGSGAVQILMWVILAALSGALLFAAARRFRLTQWWRDRRRAKTDDAEWVPAPEASSAWLAEAEALAAKGQFADAVHCLLLRSIEDLASRRPQLSSPALTGRELASSPLVPNKARALFASIVAAVEPSLFGERPVGEAEWDAARLAYRDFTLAGAWRA